MAAKAVLNTKVRAGLLTLCALAETREDPEGHVALAIAWIKARARLDAPAPKKQAPPPQPLERTGPHHEAVDALVAAWEIAFGRQYPFAPRDAAVVKRLRGLPDWKLETALARWRTLLSDQWWRARGIALKDLESQWARLASRQTRVVSQATEAGLELFRRIEGGGRDGAR